MKIFGKKRHPLSSTAQEIRLSVLEMINTASGGHIGGSLSSVEIMTALTFLMFSILTATTLFFLPATFAPLFMPY